MKIRDVDHNKIYFDNGSCIHYDHDQNCCEDNWADFDQLEEAAFEYEFNEELVFEAVEGAGFRFGNKGGMMFFVPCYSDQNGYYTEDIDIYYKNELVLNFECELRIE